MLNSAALLSCFDPGLGTIAGVVPVKRCLSDLRGCFADATAYEQARAAGHAFATVKRAKAQMGVTARKLGMAGGWAWSLPEGDQAIAKKPTPKGMGTFGINDPLRRDRDTDALE